MENKTKHLELVQGVVNRLSTNSFLLKGWSVVLVSALFALSTPNSNVSFVLLAYFPAVVFWGLDAYFLGQERLYRALYDHVRKLDAGDIDFSMDAKSVGSGQDFWGWLSALVSGTLLAFHGVLIGAIVVVMLLHITN